LKIAYGDLQLEWMFVKIDDAHFNVSRVVITYQTNITGNWQPQACHRLPTFSFVMKQFDMDLIS
jgi:hypothetical protein